MDKGIRFSPTRLIKLKTTQNLNGGKRSQISNENMKKFNFRKTLLFIATFALTAVVFSGEISAQYSLSPPPIVQGEKKSARNVVPSAFAGNFVSIDDDQICYDLAELGNWNLTGEVHGFKLDSPTGTNEHALGNASVSTTISANGQFLSWTANNNATVLGFIIKGGPHFNFYSYPPNRYDNDGDLSSPGIYNRRNALVFPQISHYNLCFSRQSGGNGEGCTPGYWRNHADRWVGYSPTDNFDIKFSVTYLGGATLGQVINNPQTYGAFAFHAVAALLNSTGGTPNPGSSPPETVDYPYTTAQVIQMVQDAVNGETLETTKNLLAAANEAGCPLGGTRAVKVQ